MSRRIVATYPYRDAQGVVQHETVKFDDKTFAQRRPNGKGGHIWGLDGVVRLPYRLPQLLAKPHDEWIDYPEGEKDAETFAALGLNATTNAEGARKELTPDFIEHFRGEKLAVWCDNDEAGLDGGRKHALAFAKVAAQVRLVTFPADKPKGYDVTDYVNEGHDRADVEARRAAAPRVDNDHRAALSPSHARAPYELSPTESPATNRGDAGATKKLFDSLIGTGTTFGHDDAGVCYAMVPDPSGRRAVYLIDSKAFSALLRHLYREASGKIASANLINEVRGEAEGCALHDGELVHVRVRYCNDGHTICIDLGGPQWRMVQVTSEGWDVVPHGDRLFRRPHGMLAFPEPLRGGSIHGLRRFIHAGDPDFMRTLMFVVCAMRGSGPYPIAAIGGEHGSAKTTTAKIIRQLVDPAKLKIRGLPKEERDLALAANNGHLQAFDNISELRPDMADALCRLTSGAGLATRALYTNSEESLFEGARPVVMTSIVDLMSRPDRSDRQIPIQLLPFDDDDGTRLDEKRFWDDFDCAWPYLFGALLDVLVVALRRLREVTQAEKNLPRLADAFLFTIGAEPALAQAFVGQAPSIREIWRASRDEAAAAALEASPISGPLTHVLNERLPEKSDYYEYEVTMRDLLDELERVSSQSESRKKGWPSSPRALSNMLKRLTPALRRGGFVHEERPRTYAGRLHVFTRVRRSAGPSGS